METVTKRDCVGCYNDEYNHGLGGAKECWSFKDAKLVKKLDVHVDQRPPYDRKALVARPNCYKGQRWIRVDVSALDSNGFWRW